MKCLALYFCVWIAAAGVRGESVPKTQISSDAKWLIHVDVQRLRSSPVGSYLLKEILEKHVQKGLGQLEMNLDSKLDIDLEKIVSVSAYGSGYQPKIDRNGVLIIRAGQPVLPILENIRDALIKKAGDENAAPLKRLQEQPFVIYASGNNDLYGTVYDSTVLVVGKSRDRVEHARSVLEGKSPNLSAASAFSGFPPAPDGFVFVGMAEGFGAAANVEADSEGGEGSPQAKVLQNSDGVRFVLGETADHIFANLALKTKNEEAGNQIQQILQGLIALVSLKAGSDGSPPEAVMDLARSAHVSSTGNVVSVAVELPSAKAMEHLKAASVHLGTKPGHHRSKSARPKRSEGEASTKDETSPK